MSLHYRLVFFDVDSTLVTIEGIDVLASGNPEVVALTEAAMNGEIPLEEVYRRRLEAIRPARADLEALAARYRESLIDGAAETITALQQRVQTVADEVADPRGAQLVQAVRAPRVVHRFSQRGIRVDERAVQIEKHCAIAERHRRQILSNDLKPSMTTTSVAKCARRSAASA